MKKTLLIVSLAMLFVGCASTQNAESGKKQEVTTIKKEYIPHLWSGHKELKYSAKVCSAKGKEILLSLGFKKVFKSKHGEYVYGNYSSNRASIKCVSSEENTFLYIAVAGPRVKVVERLRNEIMWQF